MHTAEFESILYLSYSLFLLFHFQIGNHTIVPFHFYIFYFNGHSTEAA